MYSSSERARWLMPACAGFFLDLLFALHGHRRENLLSNREDTDLQNVGRAPCGQTAARACHVLIWPFVWAQSGFFPGG
jgi:hypothetical protein